MNVSRLAAGVAAANCLLCPAGYDQITTVANTSVADDIGVAVNPVGNKGNGARTGSNPRPPA